MNPNFTMAALLGYPVPTAYDEMWQSGLIDASSELYLFLSQADWLGPSEALAYELPDYWRDEYVPFAVSVTGNAWCWSRQVTGRPGVVMYCPHDLNEATGYAACYVAAVYRLLLEEFSASWHVGRIVTSPSELSLLFHRYAQSVAPFLPQTWSATLVELSGRPVLAKRGGFGVLDGAELSEIINRDIAFSGLDAYFPSKRP